MKLYETVHLRNAALVRAKESVELMRPSEPCLIIWTFDDTCFPCRWFIHWNRLLAIAI